MNFILVFVSRDFEVGSNDSCDSRKKFSSDLNKIWYLGRGRWLMHDGMQYTRSKVKVKVTSPSKSVIWPFSKAISSP